MRNLLIYLVKLARDAGHSDKEIAEELLAASREVECHSFWPVLDTTSPKARRPRGLS